MQEGDKICMEKYYEMTKISMQCVLATERNKSKFQPQWLEIIGKDLLVFVVSNGWF